jgi:hypothetical protein
MFRHLPRLRALHRHEQQLLLAAWVLLPCFGLALRMLGLARIHTWIVRGPVVASAPDASRQADCVGALVNMAARRLPIAAKCLTRSLLLLWLLRRRGIESQLQIGVSLEQGTLSAHAWVEHGGEPVNGAKDSIDQFAAVFEIGAAFSG